MQEAGYPSPRRDRDSNWHGGIDVPGMENLGGWELETPTPSVESVLVKPKVYSHRFADGSYKQAVHGFVKYDTPDLEALRASALPREEKAKRARSIKAEALHQAFSRLLEGLEVTWNTRRSPRKLRQALVQHRTVGEFVSQPVKACHNPDPNTDFRDGWVHWLDFNRTERA
jgi:hypothetical protein